MRKLAIICLSFSLAVFISAYVNISFNILLVISAGICLAVSLFSFCCKMKNNVFVVASFFFSIGVIFFQLYYANTVAKASLYVGNISEIQAEVINYPEKYDSYSSILVKSSFQDGDAFKIKINDYDSQIDNLVPGDIIHFTCTLRSSDKDNDGYDSSYSNRVFLYTSDPANISVLEHRESIRYLPQYFRSKIIASCNILYSENTAAFMRSLLIGDKSLLYDSETAFNSLKRAGFLHTVAVSGMHISLLVGFFQIIFGKKRTISIICLSIVWFFIFITGCSSSALRAAIMQTVLMFGSILMRENDSLTSLSFSLFIILLINPFAAKTVSLQLSFGAAYGICLICQPLSTNVKIKSFIFSRIINYVKNSISISFGVLFFTVPISVLHFGSFSILSPITNLFGIWAVSLCFCMGFLAVFIYYLIPTVALFLSKIVSMLVQYILSLCSYISSIPNSYVNINSIFWVIVLLVTYVILFSIIMSKFSYNFKLTLSAVFSVVILVLALIYNSSFSNLTDLMISVLDVGQGACTCVTGDNTVFVVDCGSSNNSINAGEIAADYLHLFGYERVDALILTHLHSDHSNGISQLLRLIEVRCIFIPDSVEKNDLAYAELMIEASHYNVPIFLIESPADIMQVNVNIRLLPSDNHNDSLDENEKCMAVLITYDDSSLLITGDSSYTSEIDLLKYKNVSDISILVAGHHGAATSSCTRFLSELSPEYSVISVGENSYGHPSDITLKRFEGINTNLFRTDLNGNVVFCLK